MQREYTRKQAQGKCRAWMKREDPGGCVQDMCRGIHWNPERFYREEKGKVWEKRLHKTFLRKPRSGIIFKGIPWTEKLIFNKWLGSSPLMSLESSQQSQQPTSTEWSLYSEHSAKGLACLLSANLHRKIYASLNLYWFPRRGHWPCFESFFNFFLLLTLL